MKGKFLTIEDLYNYYSSTFTKNCNFNAEDDGGNIVVQIPGTVDFSKDEKDIEGLLPVRLVACHDGINANHSKIDKKVMEKALPSFSNRPILGYIHSVDGVDQFYGHNMHVDENDKVVYDEIPVGVVGADCNAHLEYDEEADCNRVIVDGYIFEDYTKAADILRREEKCSVSVECNVRSLEYSAKEKVLCFKDFFFSGVTILGVDDDGTEVQPGMTGSNVTISDFSKENNSMFSQEKISTMLEELNEKIDNLTNLNIHNEATIGGEKVSKFEELLAKYEVAEEDITFEYGDLDDEALEEAFAEAFEEETETEEVEEETEKVAEEAEEAEESEESEEEVEEITEESFEEESNEETEDNSDVTVEYTVNMNGDSKTFSVSLANKLNALCTLVNETYGDVDGCYYSVDAFEDTKTVEMHDFWNDKHYRQTYAVKKDVYSLKGDRTEIFTTYLSEDEMKKLDTMKSEFEANAEKLAKYEAEPQKQELIESAEYANIRELEDFKAIENDHFDMSIEEITEKLDGILLEYAKNNELNTFSKTEGETKEGSGMVQFATPKAKKTKSRYGSLFSDK